MMSRILSSGYYTALGTPLTHSGELHIESMSKQIEMQIEHHAAGLLVMGSMGIETYIPQKTYPQVAKVSTQVNGGRIPLFMGVTDVSIQRVIDRIDAIKGLVIDGIVMTVPYYNTLTQEEVYQFYSEIAKVSPYPVYLYDLAVITKTAIAPETVIKLKKNFPMIRGIKTAQLATIRTLREASLEQFNILYSGLDTMDMAYQSGVTSGLDGMFSATPKLADTLFTQLKAGNNREASTALNQILNIRNTMITYGVFPSFTAIMNLLGMEGSFHPDYCSPVSPETVDILSEVLKINGIS